MDTVSLAQDEHPVTSQTKAVKRKAETDGESESDSERELDSADDEDDGMGHSDAEYKPESFDDHVRLALSESIKPMRAAVAHGILTEDAEYWDLAAACLRAVAQALNAVAREHAETHRDDRLVSHITDGMNVIGRAAKEHVRYVRVLTRRAQHCLGPHTSEIIRAVADAVTENRSFEELVDAVDEALGCPYMDVDAAAQIESLLSECKRMLNRMKNFDDADEWVRIAADAVQRHRADGRKSARLSKA
jgi:hypothetical protein